MKRTSAVVAFFILLFIFAKWGPAINFSSTTQTKGEPFMVSGSGKVSVTPDIAKVNFGIQENGQILKQVQDSTNKKSQTLVAAFKKLGIAESDIKTTSYNVYPQYDYSASNQKITGYQVSTNYEVTIKDFDKVNDAISLGTTSGANIIGGINFDISDTLKEEKLNEARKEAADNAKSKAKGLATAAGITLGKIINVSENQTDIPRPFLMKEISPDLSGSAPQITQPAVQRGETELNVSITLSYEVR